jgi:hypothetical protein
MLDCLKSIPTSIRSIRIAPVTAHMASSVPGTKSQLREEHGDG